MNPACAATRYYDPLVHLSFHVHKVVFIFFIQISLLDTKIIVARNIDKAVCFLSPIWSQIQRPILC